jgi:hypothetical protein
MAALVAAIYFPDVHPFESMDGRDRPGHDDVEGQKRISASLRLRV